MTVFISGRELWVGPNEQHTTLNSAIQDSEHGDTIFVRAGVYENDFSKIQHDLSIVGVDGMAHLHASVRPGNEKGILVTNANTLIENIEFSGASVRDANGAGIRQQFGDLIVRNSYFHNNENGILANSNATTAIRIENSRFENNGNGSDLTHHVYVGNIESLTVADSTFGAVHDVTHIQSRAKSTSVTNSDFDDTGGTASYLINLPKGGEGVIAGNTLINSETPGNTKLVNYGASSELHPGSLLVDGNTFINNYDGNGRVYGVRNITDHDVVVSNNLFVDIGDPVQGAATLVNNQFQVTDIADIVGTEGNDVLTGTAVGDTIEGLGGNDKLYGEGGDDVLTGGAGNDKIIGGAGADTLFGGDGNDTLYVDAADAQFDGGAGTDRLIVQNASGVSVNLAAVSIEIAYGDTGNDVFDAVDALDPTRMYGGGGNDTLFGGSGNDYLRGDAGDDLLVGNGGNDKLIGGSGADTLLGGAANDTLKGDAGDDLVSGHEGNDKLYGGEGADTLLGGAGNDKLYVDGADVSIDGGAGIDTLIVQGTGGLSFDLAALSVERAIGGAGDDSFDASAVSVKVTLQGKDGSDTLTGSAGADTLKGDSADDVLSGNGGNDRLYGGEGADTLLGGAGNDKLYVDGADVSIDGGAGTDTLIVQGSAGLSFDLAALSVERAIGGVGDDSFDASDLTEKATLEGKDGSDTLIGSSGDDVLKGGDGDDVLIGGAGSDSMYGGVGDDLFVADDTAFRRAAGEDGFDTLQFTGEGQSFDLTELSSNAMSGLEAIDFAGSGDNTLVLDSTKVFSLTDGVNAKTGVANSLLVFGDTGDTVGAGAGWSAMGAAVIDGQGYSVYESTVDGATLFVADDVGLAIG